VQETLDLRQTPVDPDDTRGTLGQQVVAEPPAAIHLDEQAAERCQRVGACLQERAALAPEKTGMWPARRDAFAVGRAPAEERGHPRRVYSGRSTVQVFPPPCMAGSCEDAPVSPRNGLRFWVPVLYLAASAVMVFSVGVPTSRDLVFLWFAAGMAAFSVTDLRRRIPRLAIEWGPFIVVLFIYDRLRGFADGLVFPAREFPQVHVEAALFGKPIPTVWLQSHLWHGGADLHWWDYATWLVYLSHFFATLIVAAVLWTWLHDRFARFATMVCVLALAGFATYALYPAVPPWLAARHGTIGESNRLIGIVWHHVPIAHYGSLFEKGQTYANNVAAMPSLHAAYALLIALYLWRLVPRWSRVLLALYPPAMAFALVYSGEHYVVDCIAGWVYALAAFKAVNLWFERREKRAVALEPVLAD
jgi:membrane-associated phospholipid phosphatase